MTDAEQNAGTQQHDGAATAPQDKVVDYLRKVTTDLRRTRRRLDEIETRENEPMAVVGMACRYPGGVRSPEQLWDLVASGTDAITGFPTDRGWDRQALAGGGAGSSATAEGGFLDGVGDFDAEFFGISPREALAMDPQQRLLLEVSWEALERAGIAPTSLRDSATGVFVGSYHWGHSQGPADPEVDLGGHTLTGTAASVASGRISYTLGLRGPALTVDTACSSSLVALHLAARSLRAGESSLALVGGVTVMSDPSLFVEFSRQGGLSPDGRCRAFGEGADGTGWAEGAGVLVLERLSDARRHGHEVLAVVRGSAVNQDGASNGLTAPNGPSQRALIGAALSAAGLRPGDVDVVEAHGTGTSLGDPIEAQALLATYGRDREQPLWLGSLKSNIGHTQAAAGVGGVIKMVMALQRGMLPATLHAETPSSRVDWSAGAVRLLTEPVAWEPGERPRRAGVSSFGVSGTNAHAIIEEPPATDQEDTSDRPDAPTTCAWSFSARGPESLGAQAAGLAARLTDSDPYDVAYSLARTRASLEDRAVVIGSDREELLAGARAVAAGEPSAAVVTGRADLDGGTVFVFPGQGAQWAGMGAELLDTSPVFAEAFDAAAAALRPHVGFSPHDVVRQVPGAPGLDAVDVVQPLSFAVMVALAAVWRHHGVHPDAVLGHSQGEIAAAVVAGALSLDDGARVVALRARAIGEHLAGAGGMLSVPLSRDEVVTRIGSRSTLSVAAENGPRAVVVSGSAETVQGLHAELVADGVRARMIAVDYASHSAHVEAIEQRLLDDLAGLTPGPAAVPMLSTVTGEWLDGGELDAGYWYRNLRRTVGFGPAVETLVEQGHRAFIEVGPHPVLSGAVADSARERGTDVLVTGTLRRGRGGPAQLLTSFAEAHVRGIDVDWASLFPGGRRVALPTYPFRRRRFWAGPATPESAAADPAGVDPQEQAFWAAVEDGDVAALTSSLHADADSLAAVLPALSDWRRTNRERATLDSWSYRVEWRPVPVAGTPTLSGDWLVVTTDDDTDTGDDVVAALTAAGAAVHPVVLDGACDGRAAAAELLAAATGVASAAGVVSLLAADERADPDHPGSTVGLSRTLALVQALGDLGVHAPLWFLTRDAARTGPSDRLTHPIQALVHGLAWTAALEHPDRIGGTVDLPPGALDASTGPRLAVALSGAPGEDQLAVRPAGLFARRIVRTVPGAVSTGGPEREWAPHGTTLVTGAGGALAPDLARWLSRQGAEDLVLVGRRGPDAPGTAELVEELARLGTAVRVEACDVGDRDAVAALLAGLAEAGHVVRHVVHAVAVMELESVDATDAGEVANVLRGKVDGARHLDELLDGGSLDTFVLYTSTAGMWGSGRHAAYAAGNAYLSALAEHRRARGLPATAVHWGKWPDAVGSTEEATDPHRVRRTGLELIDPETAMAGLRRVLDHDEDVISLMAVNWPRYHDVFTSGRPTTLFDEIPEVRLRNTAADAGAPAVSEHGDGRLLGRLRPLPAAEQERLLLEMVRAEVAAVLGHGSGAEVPELRAFRDIGFDSVTAVDLRNRVAAATGANPPATMVFDHPTPIALARHLRTELLGGESTAPAAPASGAAASDDPIAVVAMSCRLPGGVASPEDLWRLVADGLDVISDFPDDRGWDADALRDPDPDAPGRTYSTVGGFLHDATEFDAGFFGISPREALSMDPQQRLLLETTWEVFERAGIDPAALRGSATGAFVGAGAQPYPHAVGDAGETHMMTGTAASVLSGRISYLFGLEGPSVTVDTACSSSLVALHLACRSLRSGESSLALAAGATVMPTPEPFVGFSRQRALATDGRCKAFADGADGMSLAEGVGVVLLERLSDARRHGHRVLALVRGSAINSDGASNGLTAPNGPSQQRVIRAALADAGITPDGVDAVEAHGTGTALGDPIEAQAILGTYGRDRDPDRPLLLGSLKSNIGHTQAAAGIAGVIKTVLAFGHDELPRTLHAGTPSSRVDWSTGAVRLLDEPSPWPQAERPRRAAVSAFGISGTNAHAVLEQAPPEPAAAGPEATVVAPGGDAPVYDTPTIWPLSARSAEALCAQAARLRESFDRHRPDGPGRAGHTEDTARRPDDVGWSLARLRAGFEHRAVVLGQDLDTLLAGLESVAAGETAPGVQRGTAAEGDRRPVFVFPGQGSQWQGMGRELLASSPVFQSTIADCERALSPHVDWSLTEVLAGDADPELSARVDVVQPALFATMVALAALWRAYGVEPAAVVGHSQGEIAAAHVAGALNLDDAAMIVALRSRALLTISGAGGMTSVAAGPDRVAELIAPWSDAITVAAVNGPSSTVVSGDAAALDELAAHCAAEGVRSRRVDVDYASHGTHVEAVRDELAAVLAGVRPVSSPIPFYSTVDGAVVDTAGLDAGYWYTNLREPVRMEAATRALLDDGRRVLLEISPRPVLGTAIEETVEAHGADTAVALGTLRRDDGGPDRVLTAVAEAHAHGVAVDFAAVFAGRDARPVDLPTYAFRRRRYWPEEIAPAAPAPTDGAGGRFWELVASGDGESLAAELGVGSNGTRSSLDAVLPALSAWWDRAARRDTADGWRYRIGWTRIRPQGAGRPAGRVLLVRPPGMPDLEPVREAFGPGATTVELDPIVAADRARAAAALADAAVGADLVVSLLAAGTPSDDGEVPAALAATLGLVQALGGIGAAAPLWCVTRGAVRTGPGDTTVVDPGAGSVWGLGRVVALEHPARWGGLIDLPAEPDRRSAEALAAFLAAPAGEDQVAVRSSGISARRLLHATPAADRPWTTSGAALVTGGTGGVGALVARWLVDRGARHLVLTSRRGPDAPGAAELVADLRERGATVTVVACDAADRAALAQVLDGIDTPGGLRSVFHAAGVSDGDAPVADLTGEQLRALLHPKAPAAEHLDELVGDRELDAFVLFSSGASAWGSGGQPGYAAANAWLDALAERRQAQGRVATSVAWGAWAQAGMATDPVAHARLERQGVTAMDPDLALQALDTTLAHAPAVAAITAMDWTRFADGFTSVRPSPLLAELAEAQEVVDTVPDAAADGVAPLLGRLAGLPPAERDRAMLEAVRTEAAATLGHDDPAAVPAGRAFRDVGFDSVTAVELRNRLRGATGLRLPASLVFDFPNPRDLARHLGTLAFGGDAAPDGPPDPDAPTRELLASIPLARLRRAGLLDELLRLAGAPEDDPHEQPDEHGTSLDDMDGESLLRLVSEASN
ncbi:type I polyketide synthase [Pseudonocardia sp. HH130630-07]|uniref:type I polyketide synthase n=1 Tax=Pseudonocardia sp. HH130630-07 TaxID=1690815 RepID=UPI00081528CD|nr:type I polyketide synthase [Pseudonocardia sp. HH130630-07]ANY10590.1 polyketide synthase [Pseudonocardia sp. HH130630-07]